MFVLSKDSDIRKITVIWPNVLSHLLHQAQVHSRQVQVHYVPVLRHQTCRRRTLGLTHSTLCWVVNICNWRMIHHNLYGTAMFLSISAAVRPFGVALSQTSTR